MTKKSFHTQVNNHENINKNKETSFFSSSNTSIQQTGIQTSSNSRIDPYEQHRQAHLYKNVKKIRNLSLPSYDNDIFARNSFLLRKKPVTNLDNNVSKLALSRLKHTLLSVTNSSCFNLFLVLILSILANSLYFKFYYLPALSDVKGSLKNSKSSRSIDDATKFNLLTWRQDFYGEDEKRSFKINSYDHVAFAPMGDDDSDRGRPPRSDGPRLDDAASGEYFESDLRGQSSSVVGLNQKDIDNEKRAKSKTDKRHESNMALHVALNFLKEGKYQKASRIYKYALRLDPRNIDALTSYAEFLELYKKDIIKAEHIYTKVINIEPSNDKALLNLKRASPLVSKIDRQMFNELDSLLRRFYDIPVKNPALKRAKRESYFLHIYHSNAIEGNTLNLQQTRHILENRMTVGGKSIMEHNEVLGLDAAMRFINHTLLYRPFGQFATDDILQIHKRVLGFCDPIESGKFRKHQVYVGKFTPPDPKYVDSLMDEFIEWLNSKQLLTEAHPVQIAALAHYKFVFIHPFYDGNGRTGRLLMNLILMKFGYPPIIIHKEDRLDYYDYLEMANQGDIKPFIRFIAKCTQRTLKEFIRICNDSYSISVDDENKMFRNDLESQELVLEKALADFDKTILDSASVENFDDEEEKIIKAENNYFSMIDD